MMRIITGIEEARRLLTRWAVYAERVLSPAAARPWLNHRLVHRMGCAEGLSPSAGGTGVSPVLSFITPFLARKGGGGMVETAVVSRRRLRRQSVCG